MHFLSLFFSAVPSLQDPFDLTVEELRLLYSVQDSPDTAVLSNRPSTFTSSAIEGVYTCRGTNEFGSNSDDISIAVQSMPVIYSSYLFIFISIANHFFPNLELTVLIL